MWKNNEKGRLVGAAFDAIFITMGSI